LSCGQGIKCWWHIDGQYKLSAFDKIIQITLQIYPDFGADNLLRGIYTAALTPYKKKEGEEGTLVMLPFQRSQRVLRKRKKGRPIFGLNSLFFFFFLFFFSHVVFVSNKETRKKKTKNPR